MLDGRIQKMIQRVCSECSFCSKYRRNPERESRAMGVGKIEEDKALEGIKALENKRVEEERRDRAVALEKKKIGDERMSSVKALE